MRRSLIILLLLGLTQWYYACQCPTTSLSMEECEKYEIIFRGKILSVKPCESKFGEAEFEIVDLYKGSIPRKFKVLFDCKGECVQEFRPGDEWIIYTRFKQVTNAMMDWCSRSRKFYAIEKQDLYEVNYGNSYEVEVRFLTEQLGVHRPLTGAKKVAENRNQKPTMTQTVIILLSSLTAMILFYWLIRKYFHRL